MNYKTMEKLLNRKSKPMDSLSVKVSAVISNLWVSTEYLWYFSDHFKAQSYIDALSSIYGERLKILNITDLD